MGKIVNVSRLVVLLILAAMLTAAFSPSSAAPHINSAGTFINQGEGYSLVPPLGWGKVGPGRFREMRFIGAVKCEIMVFPAGRKHQMTPAAYSRAWDAANGLRPGTNFERRVQSTDININGYPGILVQYTGKSGLMEIAYLRLPHQIILLVWDCPAMRNQFMNTYGEVIKSVRYIVQSSPTYRTERPQSQPRQLPTPPPQTARRSSRGEIPIARPQFVWE